MTSNHHRSKSSSKSIKSDYSALESYWMILKSSTSPSKQTCFEQPTLVIDNAKAHSDMVSVFASRRHSPRSASTSSLPNRFSSSSSSSSASFTQEDFFSPRQEGGRSKKYVDLDGSHNSSSSGSDGELRWSANFDCHISPISPQRRNSWDIILGENGAV